MSSAKSSSGNPLPAVKRTVAIESPARLSMDRRRLKVEREGSPAAYVPIEDLWVLILDYAQITLSVPLLAALAEEEVCVVVAGPKHLPVCATVPFASHHLFALIANLQALASVPKQKRIWQQIVKAKIQNQANCLARFGKKDRMVRAYIPRVASGDPANLEGQAAADYFPALFGDGFVRGADGGINAMLDYGYALVRAVVCRALCGAGLHPVFGLHHHNRYNPYALADDAMEPLRPMVDERVYRYVSEHGAPGELTPEVKRFLYGVFTASCDYDGRTYPLGPALERYAAALRRAICEEGRKVPCPNSFAWED